MLRVACAYLMQVVCQEPVHGIHDKPGTYGLAVDAYCAEGNRATDIMIVDHIRAVRRWSG